MLKRSIFNIRTMSLLPHPCHLLFYAFASSVTNAGEEQGHWIVPAKNCMDETAFVENAAEIFGELSLEPTGQLSQSLQLSKCCNRYYTF